MHAACLFLIAKVCWGSYQALHLQRGKETAMHFGIDLKQPKAEVQCVSPWHAAHAHLVKPAESHKKRTEQTTSFGINSMTSQIPHRAAQESHVTGCSSQVAKAPARQDSCIAGITSSTEGDASLHHHLAGGVGKGRHTDRLLTHTRGY